MMLTRGKCKGMLLEDVYNSDFNYFLWLTTTDMVNKSDLCRFEYDPEDYCLPFGKYSGQRISDIFKNDKSYFNFLKRKVTEFKNDKLREAILYYNNVGILTLE